MLHYNSNMIKKDSIKLLDKIVPIQINSFTRCKSIKLYIKNGSIIINKPKYVSKDSALSLIYDNIYKVYNMYIECEKYKIENAFKGQMDILYFGDFYKLVVESVDNIKSEIIIDEKNIIVRVNKNLKYDEKVVNVLNMLENLYKKELNKIISQKLYNYCEMMHLSISGYSIKKMSSRYGSCNVKTHKLNFNINLAFMPDKVISSIVVHELAHIVHPNHSKDFYNFVYKYFKDYDMCQEWIKKNSKYLNLFY